MTSAFDQWGDRYEETVDASTAFSGLDRDFFLAAKIDLLADLIATHFRAPPSLLDVGCGVGAMHAALKPLTASLAGTDPSSASLDRAAREHPGIDYRQTDGATLPWPDAGFDMALATCVFHHIDPAKRGGVAAEMRRVVKPGGLLVVIEHNPFNPLTRLAVARCPFDEDAELLAARAARGLLVEAGCRGVESRHFMLSPWCGRITGALEHLFRRLPFGAQFAAIGRTP